MSFQDPFATDQPSFDFVENSVGPKRPTKTLGYLIAGGLAAVTILGAVLAGPLLSRESLYEQPRDVDLLVTKIRAATVTVFCSEYSGSGWAIDLRRQDGSPIEAGYNTAIVTNFHVVEECLLEGEVSFTSAGLRGETVAKIVRANGEDFDLALLITRPALPSLRPNFEIPEAGQWVMAVGSTDDKSREYGLLENNVTFGRITNVTDFVVATDAVIYFGNSGGPLVNARGEVVGTNTWLGGADQDQRLGYAQSTAALCQAIISCPRFE